MAPPEVAVLTTRGTPGPLPLQSLANFGSPKKKRVTGVPVYFAEYGAALASIQSLEPVKMTSTHLGRCGGEG